MISIFDYGAGNLRSVQNTLDEIGAEYELVRDAPDSHAPRRSSFRASATSARCCARSIEMDVRDALIDRIRAGVPFLGICLGLQGSVRIERRSSGTTRPRHYFRARSSASTSAARVPHMGWNQLDPVTAPGYWKAHAEHPYRLFRPQLLRAGSRRQTAATCTYTLPYTAVLEIRQRLRRAMPSRKIRTPRPRNRAELRRTCKCSPNESSLVSMSPPVASSKASTS